MALKYSFKLIFLKFIFECVINTALQAMAEKTVQSVTTLPDQLFNGSVA